MWDLKTYMDLNSACAQALNGDTSGIAEKLAIYSQPDNVWGSSKLKHLMNP